MGATESRGWDETQLYRQFLERNPEFDGQFLTGVITTGIYCLPSCPARRPRPENVRFFKTPEQARRFGLRPCHRCHPDAFYRGEAWSETIFERTAERIRRNPAAFGDLTAVTRMAGLSRTSLNTLFQEHGHESAGAFLRRARIEKACEALAAGASATDALAASGFESASAFHQHFLARTGLTPAAFARLGRESEFRLRLPARYRIQETLAFQGRDPASPSEAVTATGFRKCLEIDGKPAVVNISIEDGIAICRTDAGNVFAAHAAAIRMLGFDCDPAGFERMHAHGELLGEIVRRQAGLRVPLTSDGWEALAWAVIGQQISLAAAVRYRREVIAAFGEKHESGMVAHPNAERIAELDPAALVRLRFPAFKAGYLIAAARAMASGAIRLSRDWSALHLAREMRTVRGIGAWTIQYSLLRGAGFADCLPASDAGLMRGLGQLTGVRPEEASVREMMARYAPFRSLATYHVWRSLSCVEEKDVE
jgi:AraC family transcriptional regulator of adaptative response / DNA-3-methyladenine glycosylase II